VCIFIADIKRYSLQKWLAQPLDDTGYEDEKKRIKRGINQ
jgi:hypothetical protein